MRSGRILHLVASSRGGGAVHVQALATALAARGAAVAVGMPADGGHIGPEDFAPYGVRWCPLPSSPRKTLRQGRALARLLRAEAPSLVHAHGARAGVWALGALQGRGLGAVRLVYSVHGYVTPFYGPPRRWLQGALERWVARRAGAVVACAEAERQALITAGVAPPDKVHTVHYGLDLSPFCHLTPEDRRRARTTLGVPPDAWLLLSVCRLDRPRDFPTLLRAFRCLRDALPRAHLFLVGEGPLRGEVEALRERLGLAGACTLWGLRRDVARFYAAADALALTSWGWEGLPLAVIEAQAAGVPVVVTAAGGAGEACVPGQTGLLVPRRAPEQLCEALLALADDPERAAAMGAQGRRYATERFRLEGMVARLERLYASL